MILQEELFICAKELNEQGSSIIIIPLDIWKKDIRYPRCMSKFREELGSLYSFKYEIIPKKNICRQLYIEGYVIISIQSI